MALVFTVKVVPGSGRVAWTLDARQCLKLFIKSPAEKNLANREVIKIISQVANVPQAEVTIIAGATSRNKVIKVQSSLSLEQFLILLGLGMQQSLFKKK
jgi:uncharacterized protein (TIGR00251 family)